MKPVRVGVVGVGAMGYHHARIYHELEKEGEVVLAGIADTDEKRARQVAEKFKTKAYTDYKQLLREDLDAVSIAVPTTLHTEVATYFAKNKVILMVGHIERFNPAVQNSKK